MFRSHLYIDSVPTPSLDIFYVRGLEDQVTDTSTTSQISTSQCPYIMICRSADPFAGHNICARQLEDQVTYKSSNTRKVFEPVAVATGACTPLLCSHGIMPTRSTRTISIYNDYVGYSMEYGINHVLWPMRVGS